MSDDITGDGLDYEAPLDDCPTCHQQTVEVGYGMMGGGCGTYWYCVADSCDYFHKEQDTP